MSQTPLRPQGSVGAYGRIQWKRPEKRMRIMAADEAVPAAETGAADPFLKAFQDAGLEAPSVPGAASAREEFIVLLQAAAEIEQALMVQYLYAMYSLDEVVAKEPRDVFLTIAIQEMGHLLSVQNMLRCLGEVIHLRLPDPAAPIAEDTYPFPLKLAPVSVKSLAQYVTAESPLADTLAEPLRSQARKAVSQAEIEVRHVGLLFLKLYWMAQPTLEKYGPWDPPLTELWEAELGSRHLSLTGLETTLQRAWYANRTVQMTDAEFLRKSAEMKLFIGMMGGEGVPPAEQICRLLYAIGAQGEGFVEEGNDLNSHFELFVKLYTEWSTAGVPEGVYPLISNPWVGPASPDAVLESTRITHPEAEILARAFNLRYERILLLIALTYTNQGWAGPALRTQIVKQAVQAEMKDHLGKIVRELRKLPAKAGGASEPKAGPPFQAPAIPSDYAGIRARLVAVKEATDRIAWPLSVTPINTAEIDQQLLDLLP